MKARTLLAAACLLLLPVAGCGTTAASPQSDEAGPGLPTLSAVQDLRDRAARSESAIALAAASMAELATECDDCRDWLEQAEADATARLQLSGGLWNPWPEATAEAAATLPQPAPIGEAPLTPTGLIGYMHKTAVEQLEALAAVEDMPAEETAVLASVLAGRLAAANRLAGGYEISAPEAASLLPDGASWPTVGVPVALPTATSGEPGSAQSGEGSAWATDAAPARALLDYDCVGTTLGFTDLAASAPTTETALYRALLERVDGLVHRGVPDQRGIRCVLREDSADEVLNSLLAADVELLSTADPAIRRLALDYLLQDLTAWMELGEPDTVSPALVAGGGSAISDTSDTLEGDDD